MYLEANGFLWIGRVKSGLYLFFQHFLLRDLVVVAQRICGTGPDVADYQRREQCQLLTTGFIAGTHAGCLPLCMQDLQYVMLQAQISPLTENMALYFSPSSPASSLT